MREQVLATERFDNIIDKAAKEAGYSEGFGIRGCDLAGSHWWAAYARQSWEEQANNNRLPDYLLTCAREAKNWVLSSPESVSSLIRSQVSI